jgi:hypothetical protein
MDIPQQYAAPGRLRRPTVLAWSMFLVNPVDDADFAQQRLARRRAPRPSHRDRADIPQSLRFSLVAAIPQRVQAGGTA